MPAPRKFKDPCDTKPRKSEPKGSPVSSTHVSIPTLISSPESPKKQRVYPNGNKGWANLEASREKRAARNENIRDHLKAGWGNLSSRTIDWLQEGDRFEELLAESKIKDIAVFLGISTEKVLLLEGQPTQIIGQAQQAKLDEMGPALLDALKKRGIVTLTERKATIEMPEKKDVMGSVG
jgi:hypothetical protein